ncbi:hypothetical protein VPH35_036800 [Triticum aestivum]
MDDVVMADGRTDTSGILGSSACPRAARPMISSMEHCSIIVVPLLSSVARTSRHVRFPCLAHSHSQCEYFVHIDITTWLFLISMFLFCMIGNSFCHVYLLPISWLESFLIRGSFLELVSTRRH